MIRNTSSFFSINRVNSNSQKQPECIFVCSKHLISWLFWTPLLSKIVIIWLHRRQEESLRRHTWHIKESSQKFEIFRISFFPMKFHNRKSRWHIFSSTLRVFWPLVIGFWPIEIVLCPESLPPAWENLLRTFSHFPILWLWNIFYSVFNSYSFFFIFQLELFHPTLKNFAIHHFGVY